MKNEEIKPTSLEEAQAVCGENLNSEETLQNVEAIVYGDASSGGNGLHAWESFSAARAINSFETTILGFPAPCGTIESCIENTPYSLSPTLKPEDYVQLGFVNSEAYQTYSKIFGDPFEKLEAKRLSTIQRETRKGKTQEEAEAIAQEKIVRYANTLPATLFGNIKGITLAELSIRDNLFLVSGIANSLFEDIKGQFEIESGMEAFSKFNLADLQKLVMEFTGEQDGVAAKCVCPECSQAGTIVSHVITYSGRVINSYGSVMDNSNVKPKCPHMQNFVNGNVNANTISMKQLVEAGFTPKGIAMYLMEGKVKYAANRILAIRDYSRSNGTVKAAATLWKGQAILTPRGYIKMGDRDANVYELAEFIRNGGVDLVKRFSNCIPIFGDGTKYTLDLQNGEIKIVT